MAVHLLMTMMSLLLSKQKRLHCRLTCKHTHRKISCKNKVFASSQMELHGRIFISNAQMAFSGRNFSFLILKNISINCFGICMINCLKCIELARWSFFCVPHRCYGCAMNKRTVEFFFHIYRIVYYIVLYRVNGFFCISSHYVRATPYD